jgi:putative solute:sodium symporter small subunit
MIGLMSPPASSENTANLPKISHATLQRRVRKLRWALLALWFSVTLCVSFFARDLDFLVFDRPFGFWMAAQGSVLVFLGITWGYALLVNRWEQEAQSDATP